MQGDRSAVQQLANVCACRHAQRGLGSVSNHHSTTHTDRRQRSNARRTARHSGGGAPHTRHALRAGLPACCPHGWPASPAHLVRNWRRWPSTGCCCCSCGRVRRGRARKCQRCVCDQRKLLSHGLLRPTTSPCPVVCLLLSHLLLGANSDGARARQRARQACVRVKRGWQKKEGSGQRRVWCSSCCVLAPAGPPQHSYCCCARKARDVMSITHSPTGRGRRAAALSETPERWEREACIVCLCCCDVLLSFSLFAVCRRVVVICALCVELYEHTAGECAWFYGAYGEDMVEAFVFCVHCNLVGAGGRGRVCGPRQRTRTPPSLLPLCSLPLQPARADHSAQPDLLFFPDGDGAAYTTPLKKPRPRNKKGPRRSQSPPASTQTHSKPTSALELVGQPFATRRRRWYR